MPDADQGEARGVRARVAPTPTGLALRPIGYALIGLVWLVIWAVALAILAGSVAYAVTDQELVEGLRDRFSSPGGVIAMVVVVVPLLALVMGPGAAWHLPTASWPLAVLSFTYVVRSLRPSYARERLSFTSTAPRGSTFGPPTTGDVAMSLQPCRPSRFTDAVMRFYVAGWSLDGRMFVATIPLGVAWSTLVVGLFPGLPAAVHGFFLVLTGLLVLTSVALGLRAWRGRFGRAR